MFKLMLLMFDDSDLLFWVGANISCPNAIYYSCHCFTDIFGFFNSSAAITSFVCVRYRPTAFSEYRVIFYLARSFSDFDYDIKQNHFIFNRNYSNPHIRLIHKANNHTVSNFTL